MKSRGASPEDITLWRQAVRDVVPLDPENHPSKPVGNDQPLPSITVVAAARAGQPVTKPQARLVHPQPVDRVALRRLARGSLPIDGRIDLHGCTQERAHAALNHLIFRARENGWRTLLIITGKGDNRGGVGILRQMVPIWLTTPPLAAQILALGAATPRHGGTGALYVQLRRCPQSQQRT